MTVEDRVREIETDTIIVKRDVNQLTTILAKIETIMEKMTDSYHATNKILAVHEQRMDTLATIDRDLDKKMERIMEEIRSVLTKMDVNNKSLVDEFSSFEDAYMDKMESMSKAFEREHTTLAKSVDSEHKSLSDRITKLERLQWLIAGGAIVLVWIIEKFVS